VKLKIHEFLQPLFVVVVVEASEAYLKLKEYKDAIRYHLNSKPHTISVKIYDIFTVLFSCIATSSTVYVHS